MANTEIATAGEIAEGNRVIVRDANGVGYAVGYTGKVAQE